MLAAQFSLHPLPAWAYSLTLITVTKYSSLVNFTICLRDLNVSSVKAGIYKVLFTAESLPKPQ